jgi:transcriptional regulator with XRE-family HTH domain
MDASPGTFLKEMRLRLQLGVREIQQMSSKIAAREHNRRFYISAARLAQIENDNAVPSQFKAFTLAAIYGISFYEILHRYGVDPDRAHDYRAAVKLSVTRPVTTDVVNMDARVSIPVRLDPSFKWERTQLVNRAVALWGEIPVAFLLQCNPRQHMYAYIGLEDDTMGPLLRPGALVMVDEDRRHVTEGRWKSEHERPIYFVELKDGYLCSWCSVYGSRLTIMPHPTSTAPIRTFSLTTEAEVIGQVVGVAMRLVPIAPANRAHAAAPLERP